MKFNRSLISLLLSAGALLVVAGPTAAANTTSGTITVTATVANNCSVSSPTIAFGSVNAGAAATNTTNTITVTCNKGVIISSLLLSDGNNFSSGKRMTNGTDYLSYNIDVPTGATLSTCPAAATNEWSTTNSPAALTLTNLFFSTGGPKNISLCASIPALQYPSGGAYTDTVTATLTFN